MSTTVIYICFILFSKLHTLWGQITVPSYFVASIEACMASIKFRFLNASLAQSLFSVVSSTHWSQRVAFSSSPIKQQISGLHQLPFISALIHKPVFIWDLCLVQFSSVQLLSHVWLFATPWIVARQVYLSITNSQSLPKLMSIESVMPSSQPSHPLSSPSPPAPNPSQHQGLF